MSVLGRGVRVGAAAFVVGLSLAGPQAVGVAAADSADADGGAASVSEDAPGSPVRVGRAVPPRLSAVNGARRGAVAPDSVSLGTPTPAAVAPARLGRASASVKSAAASPSRMQSGSTSGARVAGGGAAAVVGGASGVGDSRLSAAAVSVGVAAVPAAAAASAAVAGADVSGVASRLPGEVTAGTPGDSVTVPEGLQYVVESVSGNILDSLHNFFDSASTWLATLPGGPVRDFLGGALLLVRRTVFPSGPNPFVSGYDSTVGTYDPSVGTYRPPTEIAPDFDTANFAWYNVKGGTLPQRVLGPVLEGTDGAVMRSTDGGANFEDGVQGMITNMTGKPIVVQNEKIGGQFPTSMAILFPNEWMPYQLISTGTLQFYPIDLTTYNPSTLPERPKPGLLGAPNVADLYLQDPYLWYQKPFVVFWANRQDLQPGARSEFNEGDIADFSSPDGTIQLRVRRQHDGWQVPASPAYLNRYPNPNTSRTSDYAIFNIDVRSL